MIRPVKQIASGAAEMLGTLEQNNMAIRVPDGGEGGSKGLKFTHAGGRWLGIEQAWPFYLVPSLQPLPSLSTLAHTPHPSPFFPPAEFNTASMLSVVASLTPYSDFNQSPRNMYQVRPLLAGAAWPRLECMVHAASASCCPQSPHTAAATAVCPLC